MVISMTEETRFRPIHRRHPTGLAKANGVGSEMFRTKFGSALVTTWFAFEARTTQFTACISTDQLETPESEACCWPHDAHAHQLQVKSHGAIKLSTHGW